MNHEIHKVCKFLKVKKNFIFKRPLKYSSPNVINLKEQIKLRNKYGIDFYKLTERIRTNTLNDKKFRDIYKNINFKKKKLPLNAKILFRKKFQNDVKKLEKYMFVKVDDWK